MPISLNKNKLSGKTTKKEVLIKVEGVSKIFCRDLKKSLLYGIQDSAKDIFVRRKNKEQNDRPLRKGEFWPSKDISFELHRGECLGLIGHNGAGKTTLLKMLNGIIKPDFGYIEMRGHVGALIALGAGFNPILSGRENVYINAAILGLTKTEIDHRIEEIIDFSEIRYAIDAPVQSYSSGMQVRLGFAVASVLRPDILLLDEVLAVGDIAFQAKCFNTIASFKEKGSTFILVSHNMQLIERYCTKVMYLENGKVKHFGDVKHGIEAFCADMQSSGEIKDSEAKSQINGSGKIFFKSIEMQSLTGETVERLAPGSPVRVVIKFERKQIIDAPVKLDFSIRYNDVNLYNGTSSRKMRSIFKDGVPELGEIILEFESMPFATNSIDFYLSILNAETNEVYDWRRGIRLNLIPENNNNCIVNLKHTISINN